MSEIGAAIASALASTTRDVVPFAVIIAFFQLVVLRRPIHNARRVLVGFTYVILGLALFLVGLETALFPLGESMARQLASPEFLRLEGHRGPLWTAFGWTYAFAFTIGFSTAIAEPALLAVAIKASQVSGGTITTWGLRIAVALGVAIGVSLGTARIVTGASLVYVIVAGYAIILVQTFFAPKVIVPLAYDTGGVSTSTVTVPIVAALGLGLAENIPGRDPLVDGFGLIACAVLFPIITVMGYAQLAQWWTSRVVRKPSRIDGKERTF